MTAHPYVAPLVRELATHGVTDYTVEHSGKHLRIVFTWNGRALRKGFPATPSDTKGWLNAVQDLRRMMGVQRVISARSCRPKRRHVPNRVAAPECPVLTTKPDPLEKLGRFLDRLTCDPVLLPIMDRLEARIALAEWRLSFSRESFRDWMRRRKR